MSRDVDYVTAGEPDLEVSRTIDTGAVGYVYEVFTLLPDVGYLMVDSKPTNRRGGVYPLPLLQYADIKGFRPKDRLPPFRQ